MRNLLIPEGLGSRIYQTNVLNASDIKLVVYVAGIAHGTTTEYRKNGPITKEYDRFWSMEKLAVELNLSYNTIYKSVKKLERLGIFVDNKNNKSSEGKKSEKLYQDIRGKISWRYERGVK